MPVGYVNKTVSTPASASVSAPGVSNPLVSVIVPCNNGAGFLEETPRSTLRELGGGELVEIGAHTLTHPVLADLAPDQQQHEIGGSKRRLEALTGRKISSFAYPYGRKNHYTRQSQP